MVEQTDLIQNKVLLLKCIEQAYKQWDGSAKQAVQILSDNEQLFQQLKEIDEQLSERTKSDFSAKQQSNWKTLIEEHKKMVETIKEEKVNLFKQMEQVNKKDKIVSNYIDKKQSLFVDRDA